jgi:2-methylisocitrate lyase-like PEP mutase family enzyme
MTSPFLFDIMKARKTSIFRRMLEEPGIIIAPGAYDALSAKIIERLGFNAIMRRGYGTAASLLGVPDIGLVNFREL